MRALIFPLVFLAGCAINSSVRIANWPPLKVVENYVSSATMFDRCQKYAPWGSIVEACAEFDLAAGVCNIYYNKEFPPPQRIIDHEREHCAGYDHVGGTEMRALLEQFNREFP